MRQNKNALGRCWVGYFRWVAMIGLLLAAGGVQAQNWTGNTSNAWNTGTNWLGGAAPSTTTASIFFNFVASGNTSVTLNGVNGNNTVNHGATLTFNSTQDYSIFNGTILLQQSGTGTDGAGFYLSGNSGNVTIYAGLSETGSKNDNLILQ